MKTKRHSSQPSYMWARASRTGGRAMFLVAMLAAACNGDIGPTPANSPTGSPAGQPDPARPGEGEACEIGSVSWPTVSVPRRLTRAELVNTLYDVLGVEVAASAFPFDSSFGGFAANREQAPAANQVSAIFDTMQGVAIEAGPSVAKALGCELTEQSCVERFTERYGRLLYRRALTAAEHTELSGFIEGAVADWGTTEGLALTLHAMLASPNFLYLLEPGTDTGDRMTGEELITRWALALWQSTPSLELLEAAEAGALDTEQGRLSLIDTMLADPRAERGIGAFHQQWLLVDGLAADKDDALFPTWTDDVVAAAQAEIGYLGFRALSQGESFAELMTTTTGYVDPALAEIYGVDPPGAAAARVQLPAETRTGLFTRAAILARTSHADAPSVVLRGEFVRAQLLCDPMPEPPPGADDLSEDRLVAPSCSVCHQAMDPIGFAFADYDTSGRQQPAAAGGEPYVAEGGLPADDSVVGPFEDVADLARKLAQSHAATQCYATTFLRFAERAGEDDWHACGAATALEHAAAAGGGVRDVVVQLLNSDAYNRLPKQRIARDAR